MYKFNFYHTRPENFFRNDKAEQTKGLVLSRSSVCGNRRPLHGGIPERRSYQVVQLLERNQRLFPVIL